MTLTGTRAYAASRKIEISVPASAIAGTEIGVSIIASTDVGGGENIGFFHAEYSTDAGATWISICYSKDEGPSATHSVKFTAGHAGSKAIVRVRVAFRGGKAGDVDFTGKPIQWDSTWEKWTLPPAKSAIIAIKAG